MDLEYFEQEFKKLSNDDQHKLTCNIVNTIESDLKNNLIPQEHISDAVEAIKQHQIYLNDHNKKFNNNISTALGSLKIDEQVECDCSDSSSDEDENTEESMFCTCDDDLNTRLIEKFNEESLPEDFKKIYGEYIETKN